MSPRREEIFFLLTLFLFFQWVVLLIFPIYLSGFINRTQAIWTGRKGRPLNQLYFDLRRLMYKTPVYSEATSWIFQLAPWVTLGSTLLAALLLPLLPGYSPISFEYDFVFFAYLLGLGRFFLILSALDTGSSFEGMGASREATYSALIEPAFLIALGSLVLLSGQGTFSTLFGSLPVDMFGVGVRFALFGALFILLQIEAARIPVDDPNTHLELTMIHEVMILDHSGPELAAMQYVAALKFTMFAGLISALLNPFSIESKPISAMLFCLISLIIIAITVGFLESLIARFKLSVIPRYTLVALIASLIALVIATMGKGGQV